MYSENCIKINNYTALLMNPQELWKEYSNNGWTGDDIEYYLELENEEKETS
jgi:hypothetical protein